MAAKRRNHGTPAAAAAEAAKQESQFVVKLSLRFLLGCFLGASAIAFAVGRLSVVLFLEKYPLASMGGFHTEQQGPRALPPPLYSEQKRIPHTVYSSKQFATGAIATTDTLLARRAHFRDPAEKEVTADGTVRDTEEIEDEVHEPVGQHLLIDIKSVEGTFLNSEDRLARAMIDLVQLSGLTMLSYHCHGLEPVGVSCVGVLLESHIAFHTWPIPGVITLDLFTCGPSSLLSILPDIERLFGVPRWSAVPGDIVEKPHMLWAHKHRGFHIETGDRHGKRNPENIESTQFLLGWLEFDMKKRVDHVESNFQTVDIYDVINPRFSRLESYQKSLKNDGSYEATHPELFRPERLILLDGITQSKLRGEVAYHESLVHPAMFAHPNPKRVAILGGGEGATLREVLKHSTVETATMVEIDEIMTKVSQEHLPEWSDCSNLVGSAKSCFGDPRADVHFTDAVAWFIERFSDKDKIDPKMQYDVIIMDVLDPSSDVEFSDMLYDNFDFMNALSNALTENGVFVAQTGEAPFIMDPPMEMSKKAQLKSFIDHLEQVGFTKILRYNDAHGGFLSVWSYLIAFKGDLTSTLTAWYGNEAEIEFRLQCRLMRTHDGSSPLLYFDGASMMNYQYDSRVTEEVHCRKESANDICYQGHGFDPERLNAPISAFEVLASSIPNAGRGVFVKEDIAKGSYIAIDEGVHSMLIMPEAVWWINLMRKTAFTDEWKIFDFYLYGYGFESDFYGGSSYAVDPGILTFMNHGCDGSNTMEWTEPLIVTERTADPNRYPDELDRSSFENVVYSPFCQRNHMVYIGAGDVAARDLKPGDELLDNYLQYYTEENWARGVLDLKAQCSSHSAGVVSEYEDEEDE